MNWTRRRTVAGLAALAAMPLASVALAEASPAVSRLGRFRDLSASLTGFDVERIHPDRALGIVEALVAAGHGPELDRLLAGDDDEGLALRVLQAWYLGEHPSRDWPASRLFHEALVWEALDFTLPPGFCAQSPEAWQQPPVNSK